jgi:CheY-like chemotaxis protein
MQKNQILIVDDNLINLKLIRVLLSLDGYEIKTATNAQEVFDVLENFHPQVILMDIQLPGVDGLEITKRIKADNKMKDVVIIGLTAYAMKGDKEKILAAGCDDYISKPIDTEKLPGIIKKYFV